MIAISNEDARTILNLLERGNTFYRTHATALRHVNDGRRMAVMATKLKKKIYGKSKTDIRPASRTTGTRKATQTSNGRGAPTPMRMRTVVQATAS